MHVVKANVQSHNHTMKRVGCDTHAALRDLGFEYRKGRAKLLGLV